MLTHLAKKNNKWICHNCRMEQKKLQPTCWFCDYFFSNYEAVVLENYKEVNNEISNDLSRET